MQNDVIQLFSIISIFDSLLMSNKWFACSLWDNHFLLLSLPTLTYFELNQKRTSSSPVIAGNGNASLIGIFPRVRLRTLSLWGWWLYCCLTGGSIKVSCCRSGSSGYSLTLERGIIGSNLGCCTIGIHPPKLSAYRPFSRLLLQACTPSLRLKKRGWWNI